PSAISAAPSGTRRSQASPGASQSGSPANNALRTAAIWSCKAVSAPGPAINVTIKGKQTLPSGAPAPNYTAMNSSCDKPVVIIAGPTASGKSALALEVAAARGGTIINADSQQIYRDLTILSARPDAAAIDRVPHRLYGFLDATERGYGAVWRERAWAEIEAAHAAGRLPFLVGGTGLYLRAMQRGLAPLPAIPAVIRADAGELYD